MNRLEVMQILKSFFRRLEDAGEDEDPVALLKPFLDIVLSLKKDLPLSIPALRALASLIMNKVKTEQPAGAEKNIIYGRINRKYKRLCRIQDELSRLNLKKAAPGVVLEDFIFSQIDFSRYREINADYFENLYVEGLGDFDGSFYKKNFNCAGEEIRSIIEKSYEKVGNVYKIRKENPLILSIMRNLETSLETLPLLSPGEINEETKNLLDFAAGFQAAGSAAGGIAYSMRESITGMELLYRYLVPGLDSVRIFHEDGISTELFISGQGELSGTFYPGNKPWTLILISF